MDVSKIKTFIRRLTYLIFVGAFHPKSFRLRVQKIKSSESQVNNYALMEVPLISRFKICKV